MFQEKGIQGAAGSLKNLNEEKIPHNLTTDSYALRKKQARLIGQPGRTRIYTKTYTCLKFCNDSTPIPHHCGFACLLIFYRDTAISFASWADLYLNLAISHSFVIRLILVIRKDAPCQFGYWDLLLGFDVISLIWCISTALAIWTCPHLYASATTGTVGIIISCAYTTTHILPSVNSSSNLHDSENVALRNIGKI